MVSQIDFRWMYRFWKITKPPDVALFSFITLLLVKIAYFFLIQHDECPQLEKLLLICICRSTVINLHIAFQWILPVLIRHDQ